MKLKQLLFEKKIKQNLMAKELQINNTTLNNYINEITEPKIEVLKKIAKYLNVSLDYLCDNEKNNYELLPKQEEIIEIIKTIKDNNDLAQIKAYLLGFKDKELSTEEKIKNILKDIN